MENSPAGKQIFRRYGVAIALLIILTTYALIAHARRERLATPATSGDQGAYLAYARQMYETNYDVIGQRNRMPIYPFVLSLIYQPGITDDQFLERAQAFNINLSVVLLLLLYFIFRRFFSALYALGLLATTAFGVFLYRATNAQTEILFYFLSFCAFLLLLQMLIGPRWWLAIAGGATVGLAYLTKASILPGLGIWGAVFLCQSAWKFKVCRNERWSGLGRCLTHLILVVAAFITAVSPYLRTNKRIFGRYFYNESSTFVMWCDSWPEAHQFLDQYGRQGEWQKLSKDQIPSPSKYWREHSLSQIIQRLVRGLGELAILKMQLIGYYKFAVFFLIAGIGLWLFGREEARAILIAEPFATAFCLLFLASYFVLYAWYGAIVKDTRFILSIFLPFVISASFFICKMGKDRSVQIANRRFAFAELFSGGLIGLALIDVAYNAVISFA